MRPRIAQTDDRLGFHWCTIDGRPVSLPELCTLDDEPERLVPTHLSALDDALIDAVQQFGELLGGGRLPAGPEELRRLEELYRVLDRLVHEYDAAASAAGLPVELRAGQIVGTAALVATRARMALGVAGPVPLEGTLIDPGLGVVAGHGRLAAVDPAQPWRGSRWVVEGEDGRRFPLTLSMLLFDSSGVNKSAAEDEHREALRALTAAVEAAAGEALGDGAGGEAGGGAGDEAGGGEAGGGADAVDPVVAAGAVEWLLYDWLLAHRESASSGAVEITRGRTDDAAMIITAAAAAARLRARTDPTLLAVPSSGA